MQEEGSARSGAIREEPYRRLSAEPSATASAPEG
ncbi:MAG: hypothetical protein QOD65_2972 [Gaiellales bacterium]|jgi:hypothetical protein|nr:hypothetical protein [Gaiellales bacterium]MDX6596174.1 hypothetical protein [Gaiellales bacterium]